MATVQSENFQVFELHQNFVKIVFSSNFTTEYMNSSHVFILVFYVFETIINSFALADHYLFRVQLRYLIFNFVITS